MTTPPDQFDGPWKETLTHYVEPLIAFFLPDLHAKIDWQRGVEFLDQELQQLIPADTETGARRVDKLIRVWFGTIPILILIHIEVQNQYRAEYERILAAYHILIRAAFPNMSVLTLAIYGDDKPGWRPNQFVDEIGGCRLQLDFPTIKLLDYLPQLATLESSTNPLAVIVAAHLYTIQTRRNPEQRLAYKRQVYTSLYERGFEPATIQQLFRLIDWLLRLPKPQQQRFRHHVHAEEEQRNVTYITSIEAMGIEQGLQQGRETVTLRQLTRKFGALAEETITQIRALDSEQLLNLAESLLDFTTPDDLTAWLAANPPVAE